MCKLRKQRISYEKTIRDKEIIKKDLVGYKQFGVPYEKIFRKLLQKTVGEVENSMLLFFVNLLGLLVYQVNYTKLSKML